jgi:hypothetical protein
MVTNAGSPADGAGDLMSRLGSFLPKLQAANKALLQQQRNNNGDGQDNALDAHLEPIASVHSVDDHECASASHEEDSLDSDVDPISDDEETEDCGSAVPTIELTLALGQMDENPAIRMLLADEEDSHNDVRDTENSESSETKSAGNANDRHVSDLLLGPSNNQSASDQEDKPLIVEISSRKRDRDS